MANQSYKKLNLTKGIKTSLAQLFVDNGLSVPPGEVSFELQNANTQGLIYVSFGDQSGLSDYDGSPLPAFWAREEVEALTSVFVQTGVHNCAISVTVSG